MKKGQKASNQWYANKEKSCIDCFHCKVSRKSIVTNELCFCAKKKRKSEKTPKYWQDKNICRLFEDASA